MFSAHIDLRRSVACNRQLTPDLVAVLAADDDFAVRPLHHPSFQRAGLAALADSPDPDPGARALVALDPDAPPELVERLSRDPHPAVWAHAGALADDLELYV